jgi:hypothetical protein
MDEGSYAIWRFKMWLNGYGSYEDIQSDVDAGELVPGREYPPKGAIQQAAKLAGEVK